MPTFWPHIIAELGGVKHIPQTSSRHPQGIQMRCTQLVFQEAFPRGVPKRSAQEVRSPKEVFPRGIPNWQPQEVSRSQSPQEGSPNVMPPTCPMGLLMFKKTRQQS